METENSESSRGRRKNMHIWHAKEDEVLVTVLLEWKHGWKLIMGHLGLDTWPYWKFKLPSCGLKFNPIFGQYNWQIM